MPIIDERGRVFGRLNLVDAAVGALLLVLLPAAYASYALFKDPAPTLTAVVPSAVRQSPGQQVEVRGEHFRPYMRVSFNNAQGKTFLFYSPSSAFVQLPDLPPGTYDVVLYDYMQEVVRLPSALTVEPPPPRQSILVDVSGELTSLTPNQVERLQLVSRFPEAGTPIAEVLSKGAAEPETWRIKTGETSALTVPGSGLLQVPVRMRMRCVVETGADGAQRCTVDGVPLMSEGSVHFPGLGTTLTLRVHQVMEPKS
jgi:hypothetical protein